MNRKKFSALVISALLLVQLSISAALPDLSWAESDTHYIAVASDRHNETTAIAEAMSGMPDTVEYVCLNGDMTNFDRPPRPQPSLEDSETGDTAGDTTGNTGETGTGEGETGSGDSSTTEGDLTARPSGRTAKQLPYNTSDVLSEVQSIFPALTKNNVSIIYASHDSNATDDAGIMKCADTSMLPSSDAADHQEISEGKSGLIYTGENDSYYIYGVSYYDMKNAEAGQAAAEQFRTWVTGIDPSVPVILIGHVPIHQLRNDNKGATYWNKALNYAATGSETPAEGTQIIRDVVYLHGHNHSRESTEYYLAPGDRIHAEGDDEESDLYYTYITAGYLTTSRTATLLAITDDSISFTKYTGTKDSTDPSVPSLLGSLSRVRYYTVSFSEGADAQTFLAGGTAVKPQDPVREGYTFGGWYTDEAFTDMFDFSTPVMSNIKLYAKWAAIEKDAAEEESGTDPEPAVTPENKTDDNAGDSQNDNSNDIAGTGDDSAEDTQKNDSNATVETEDDSDEVIQESDSDDAVKTETSGDKDSQDTGSSIVRTGDESRMVLWSTMMLISLISLVILLIVRIRSNRETRY